MTYADGTHYRLPEGLSWQQVSDARKRWDIAPNHAPVAIAPGCIAWGTLLAHNYQTGEGANA